MIPLRVDNPTRGIPYITCALLGACLLVFVWQLTLAPRDAQIAIYALGVTPAVLFGEAVLPAEAQWVPAPLTVLTSMFLHGGVLHLLGNMLYLWIFGRNVEEYLGHGRFLLFFVLSGIVAAFAQSAPDPTSQLPMIGASGAISGVLGAYLLLYPRTQVVVSLLVRLVRLPAAFVLAFWFLLQLASSFAAPAESAIAFRAHVGGFIGGAGLILLWRRSRRKGG